MSTKIRKRSGEVVAFDKSKIEKAISLALREAKRKDESRRITEKVLKVLIKGFKKVIPTVEDIQDIVEDILIEEKMSDVAKAYIMYRAKHKDLRDLKHYFGVKDNLKLSLNAITVLQKRYLKRDAKGNVVETPEEMFKRVAKHIASAEKTKIRAKWEEEFFEAMKELDFLPNTPCLVNAGNPLGQLFACFVLDVPDSMDKIFETLKQSSLIFKTGGGIGYSFSNIRPSGSIVSTTGRMASGPVTFMEVFDKASDVIKRGGIRRGAMMGVLRVDHPDIFTFVGEKNKGKLTNFNVSVSVTDDFMRNVVKNKDYWLKDNEGKKVQKVNAREVFDFICSNAWECGDPGLLFIDEINRKQKQKIEATNVCGEVPLLPNEACCLGSVNLSQMVRNGKLNWVKLAKTTRTGVRFLDNMITLNKYPNKDIEKACKANRKIGLGVMGWADMLLEMNIKYDSDQAIKLAKETIRFIKKIAEEESERLAKEKGAFPNMKNSSFKRRRNATLLSIAPTGTISMIAGCSSGIEPLFGVAYVRNILGGMELFEINKVFEQYARYRGFYTKELMIKISQRGSVQGIKGIPKDVQRHFVTSLDIPLEWHVKMQAAFQSGVDNAVSKTINLTSDATIGDIKRAYMLAWKYKCKGITVYRYGSKEDQVLTLGKKVKRHTKVHLEYSGGHMCKNCEY